MNSWFFLIVAFGMLSAVEKMTLRKHLPLRVGALSYAQEGLELFGSLFLVEGAYFLVVATWVPELWQREGALFFSLAGAFVAERLLKRGCVFFLEVFSLSLTLLLGPPLSSPWQEVILAGFLAGGITIFEMLLMGLIERLYLTPVPQRLHGLPIFFLTACLLALAFGGFRIFFAVSG